MIGLETTKADIACNDTGFLYRNKWTRLVAIYRELSPKSSDIESG